MSKKDNLRAKKLMKRFSRYYANRNTHRMENIFTLVTKFTKDEV